LPSARAIAAPPVGKYQTADNSPPDYISDKQSYANRASLKKQGPHHPSQNDVSSALEQQTNPLLLPELHGM